jgi:hypothetical protein
VTFRQNCHTERFFSQETRIINKDRNRLNKNTFEYIIALKSWGLFREKEKKEEVINIKENIFEIN